MKNSLLMTFLASLPSYAQKSFEVIDSTDLTDFDLYGYELVTGGMQTQIKGGVLGSNQKIELGAASSYELDLFSGGTIERKDPWSWGQSIRGDVYTNQYIAPDYITIAPTHIYALPEFTLRKATAIAGGSYGTQDIHIADNQSLDLAPGNYGHLTMGPNTKLRLHSGIYNFKSFSSAPVLDGASSNVAEIIYDLGSTEIQINVFDKLFFAANTKTVFAGAVQPSKINWSTWQLEQLDLISDAAYFYGNIHAPQAKVALGNGSQLIGSIRAKIIDLGYSTKICAPPTLNSLWHSSGTMYPNFDPMTHAYKSTVAPSVNQDTLFATTQSGLQIGYPDGKSINPQGNYRIQLFDPSREAFLPGCGANEYSIEINKSPNYMIFAAGDDWNCPEGSYCTGQSWAAATDLSSAIKFNTEGKEIWLKKGTYTLNNTIKDDYVILRGGFEGTESDPDNRKSHPNHTILSQNKSSILFKNKGYLALDNVRILGASSVVQKKGGRFYLEQAIVEQNSGTNGVLWNGIRGAEGIMKRNYLSKNNLLLATGSLFALGFGTKLYLENNAIVENHLSQGALFSGAGSSNQIHNTVAYNENVSEVFHGGSHQFLNNLIWQPGSTLNSGANLSAQYSLFHQNVSGTANLNADPKIKANAYGNDGIPFTADDGLMPESGSPVVDVGLFQEVGVDIITNNRPAYGVKINESDIGVREYYDYQRNLKICDAFGENCDGNVYINDWKDLDELNRLFYKSRLAYVLINGGPSNKHLNKKDKINFSWTLNTDAGNCGSYPNLQMSVYDKNDGMMKMSTNVGVNSYTIVFFRGCGIKRLSNILAVGLPENSSKIIGNIVEVPNAQF